MGKIKKRYTVFNIIMTQKNGKILKIVQVKTKERIIVPKIAREKLKVNNEDHVAFIEDDRPGLRLQKIVLPDMKNE